MKRILPFLFLILISGCSSSSDPGEFLLTIEFKRVPHFTLTPGERFEFELDILSEHPEDIEFYWYADGGIFSDSTSNPVQWWAPYPTGWYTVSCEVSEGEEVRTVSTTVGVTPEREYIRILQFVSVDGGAYEMGDTFDLGDGDEKPVHIVQLNDFDIGEYEVTNSEYADFIFDDGYETEAYWSAGGFGDYTAPGHWDNSNFNGDLFPVVAVSWYEAMAYCSWLTAKTDEAYRLPTEAEWERAATGSTAHVYPWSLVNHIDGSFANYSLSGDPHDEGTTPVGFYNGLKFYKDGIPFETKNNRSEYGAFDMAGNAWEWCLDWYSPDYYQVSPDTNPLGPESGTTRVIRGGSWGSPAHFLRCANRDKSMPQQQNNRIGFRIVRIKSQ